MKMQAVLWGMAMAVLVSSCQSAPPAVAAPETPPAVSTPESTPTPAPEPVVAPAPVLDPDTITVSRDGFSPLASPPNHTLTVSMHWSDPSTLVEWAVAFTSGSDAARTIRGTTPVPTLDWDGKTDAGVLAPQGTYTAVLMTAGQGGELVERARTIPFVLDIVPPSGTMTVDPSPFVLGPADVLVTPPSVVTIGLNLVSGGASWTTWRLAVFHPDGRRFRDFISEDHRDDRVVWDGRALNNAQLEAGTTYRLEAEVFDVYGNRGLVTASLPVAAPAPEAPAPPPPPVAPKVTTVTVTLNGELLATLPLYFAPYSSDLSLVTGDQRASNDQALARLFALLKEAAGTAVTVVGHANQVLYQDPVKAAYEQRETLLPLSLARAEAVRTALEGEGIEAGTLGTLGVGAADPVAPFSDPVNRWKNRRVVLELTQ